MMISVVDKQRVVCPVATIALKDAPATENASNSWIVRTEGRKNWLLLLLKSNAIVVPDLSYKNNPTARSGTARPKRHLLKDAGIDGKYNMALIVRTF